ncbi:cell division protein FtsL, partial [Roseomonas mucosa]
MIRPLTLLTLLAASGAGLHLYKVKHEVALLDRELAQIQAQTEAAKARTGILKAEWQLLNEPERLRRNVEQYLPLETMQPGQFIRAADIDKRLPQAVAFAGPRNLFAVPADTAVAAAETAGQD